MEKQSTLLRNRFFSFIIVFAVCAGVFSDSYALPEGGSVAAGSAVISSPTPDTVQVNQGSDKAIVNWQSFNVSSNEQVRFQQPDASSIILNRINPYQGVSEIYGRISANGQVWLVNPAGIYFGSSARVDVAGILATTGSISNQDFMAGNYHFVQSPDWNGAIINDGFIKTAEAGLVALVGSGIVNNGYIEANLGTVILAAGSEYTVHFSGNNLIEFTVDKEVLAPARDRHGVALKDGVNNMGTIVANGGKIAVTAHTASKILDNAINMSGIAQANSVGMKNGVIILMAGKKGNVNVTGKLIASGRKSGERGGKVYITGNQIKVLQSALIDVSGDVGGGEVFIGGDYQGKNLTIQNAKNTFVGADVAIVADAITAGNGGKVIVWSDKNTQFYGTISARGGIKNGDGGFVETSGKKYLDVNHSVVDLRAPAGATGTWLLDPTNIYIALNQANATTAGMTGSDNTANIGTTSFQATGAIQDSLLTTGTLNSALALANVVVTTTNAAGTGLGNITVVDPISWATASTLTLTAANNIAINAGITTGTAASALILNATGSVTQTAAIGGSGGLTKQGVGTLTLSQNNTYTGTTTITTGIVNVQHNSGLGTAAGATTIASGAAVQIDGSGLLIAEPISSMIGTGVNSAGALRNLANSNEWSGGIVLGAGGAAITSDVGTLTLSGGITGATRPLTIAGAGNMLINSVIGTTTGTLTKNSSGLLTLSAINTYSGATAVNAGQLTLSGGGTATSTAFSVASNSKLTLDNSGANNGDRIANALTLTGGEFEIIGNSAANTTESVGTLTLTSGYSTVTVSPNAAFNTQLTFASFSRSAGAGVLFRGVNLGLNTVASRTANNSNIVFTVAPTLTGVAGAVSGTTTVNILGGAIGDGGATGNTGSGTDFVTYNPTGGSVNGLRPLLASEYAAAPAANVNLKLTANRTADDTFSINSLLLSGGITYNFDNTAGANTLTLGAAALSGNVLSIGGTNTIQTTTAPSGGLAFGTAEAKIFAVSNLTLGSNVPVAGTGSLTKNGAGVLLENRSVAISGGIRVNAGTILAGAANAFSTAQAFTVLAPGALNFNGFNNTITTLTLNSGATTGATVATGGAGTLTLGGAVALNVNGSGAVGSTISGNLALGGVTRTFTVNNGTATNDLTISAVISDGIAGITTAGAGTLSLSGTNTYAGLTTVSAGTLDVANASGLGSTASGTSVSGTLQINNVAVGAEAITFNNAATLSGTGAASLDGNITLGGTAATRTISTLLGSDVLTLNGTIDGLAAALTIGGLGTVNLQNTVGSTTPLTTITSNAGSTLGINGGIVKTSGAQTYNGIITMTSAPATFEVTGALSDILMPNTLNNINQTVTYAVSGAGSIRDITLANNNASAVIPTLPSGLRNVSFTFNNAAINLPALTLTGTLTAFSLGGDMIQSGALVITGLTTLGSGSFNATLTNASNNFGTLTVNGGVDVSVRDTNAIILGGATAAVSGNYSVTSGGAITDTTRISANTLTTSSVGGTTLDFANHTISNFNATNTTSGGITLINTIPISLTGISQSGGGTTVSITNTGTVSVPDGVTIGSGTTMTIIADDLNLNTTGAIASGTTTAITQRLAGGSIGLGNTAGTMTISGSELQRITATGLTLTNSSDGAMTVDGISATNSANISGTITLTATTGTLGTLSFINNASSFRTLTTSSDADTNIAANLATTIGALALTVTGGTLSIADGATALSNTTLAVTANDLNLNATGALTSTTTMAVTQNVAAGSIGLGNTAGTMSISGSELQRMTATGLTLTNSTNGAINVDGITSVNSANISGTITLTATTGTLGALSFINNASSFRALTGSSDVSVPVNANLSTTVGALSLTVGSGELSIADGVTALSNTTLAVAANDLNLNTTGALTSTTTMSVAENAVAGTLGLGNTAGTMTISGAELQRMTATGLTLTNAADSSIFVDGITAADTAAISGTITLSAVTGTLGTLSFINNASTFKTLTANSDAGTTVGVNLATSVGALAFTVNGGTLSVSDGATALSNTTLAVSANDLNLNTTGALTSATTMSVTQNIAAASIGLGNTAGAMTISGSELQRMTATGLTATNASNGAITVDGITAANSANISGATTLTATTGTLGTLSFLNNASSFRTLTTSSDAGTTVGADVATTVGGLSFTVTGGALDVSDGATASSGTTIAITANDLNLNTTGALNSGTSTTITNNISTSDIGLGNVAGSMFISGTELQHITAGTLSIVAALNGNILADGVTAANTANVSGTISLTATNGTLGAVSFQTASSTFTNGLTIASDNTVSVADGIILATTNAAMSITASEVNLNTTGALNSGSGDTTIAANAGIFGVGGAAGTMTLTGSELQRITANNLTLTNANNSAINVDGVQAADVANIASTVTLSAVTGATGSVVFQTNASTFKSLSVLADDTITLNMPVTTTVGSLAINSNVNGGAGGETNLNANVTSAGSVSFTAPTAGIILGAPIAVTGNGITFNNSLDGTFDLIIDAGTGDLTLVENVGAVNRLGGLTINNVNNIVNTLQLNVTSYNQLAGNLTGLGATGLNATGSTVFNANNVTGAVNVGSLALNTSAANLNGFVNGQSGQAAINNITLLNTITAGTHFFDGIDMLSIPVPPPVPPVPPIPTIPGVIPQIMSYSQNLPPIGADFNAIVTDYTGQIYLDNAAHACTFVANDIVMCANR